MTHDAPRRNSVVLLRNAFTSTNITQTNYRPTTNL